MARRSNAALALIQLGERERARVLAREELELAQSSGAPRAIGVALRVCGLCARWAEAVGRLKESVETLEPVGATLEYARARLELGAAVRRSGERRAARSHLQIALALEQGAGATGAGAPGRNRAARSGRPGPAFPRGRGAGPHVKRAAGGRAGRAGAHQPAYRRPASVSVKAVEWHLHKSYGKLEISGRGQLADALAP